MGVFEKPLSLRTKVISLIILIVAVVLTTSTYLSVRLSERLLVQEVKENAITLARELAAGFWSRADLEDASTLKAGIEEVMQLRPLVRRIEVYVLSPHGLTLVASSSGKGGFPQPLKAPPPQVTAGLTWDRSGRFWEVTAPIRVEDEAAGALRLKVSLKRADELATTTRLHFFLVMGGAVVLIVGLLSIFFHRAVDKPVRELVRTMERAEAGELSARAQGDARGEIGQMGESLNRMLSRIEDSYRQNVELLQQINSLNVELKGTVRAATEELETRNEDLKRTNELLFDTQLRLSRSERLAMVGEMAATVAHEIGTPLSSISGHVQLLLQEPAVDPTTTSRLKIVEGQIARTVDILQGILNLSRQPGPALRPLDVNSLLKEILGLTWPGLGLKNVTVKDRFSENLPPVQGDAHQLQQVFLNLIVNAVDAMPQGGELRVETDSVEPQPEAKASPWVRIQITDTGRGIALEDQKRIFEPFFTTKDLGRGTGLGLPVCQRILKAHQGTIEVRSQVGVGSTFVILLPPEERKTDVRSS
jgi:two-component system, NtrC family, sensor kinase